MIIDSHHHFWNYDPDQYAWIGSDMGVIKRDFGSAELAAELRAAGVDLAVSVQARQCLDETTYLLDLASGCPLIAGVVGWIPLADQQCEDHLDRFLADRKFVGVRHIIQDEPDEQFILGEAFNQGVKFLASRNLVYDILIYQRHLPQTIEFVDRHPNQVFVLDHIAKPVISGGPQSEWLQGISQLAKRENVSCKISGVVTEVRLDSWNRNLLLPYLDHVIAEFGPDRLMFGSDWPVCLLRSNYRRWAEVVRGTISSLSEPEQDAIMGKTAARVYRLE